MKKNNFLTKLMIGVFILILIPIFKEMDNIFSILSIIILIILIISFFANVEDTHKIDEVLKEDNNIEISEEEKELPVDMNKYDKIYQLDEDEMVEAFIKRELKLAGINEVEGELPSSEIKRKKILYVFLAILIFFFISMIFFHFPLISYLIGFMILVILYSQTKNFTLTKYLAKQVEARPNEKISNIIMSAKSTIVKDDSKNFRLIGCLLAILLPLIIFFNPIIIYEPNDEGYQVRYYIFGLTNFTKVEIPSTHNGKPVTGLRGNAFSNMFLLKEAYLPDSITEIRGEAFRNDYLLTTVKLPSNLYEIKGYMFENCKSLKSIKIPDSVVRIGGHAFYGASSLSKVEIGEFSNLNEIGSSAFRLCPNLYEITIPAKTYVNERAFKESPTRVTRR